MFVFTSDGASTTDSTSGFLLVLPPGGSNVPRAGRPGVSLGKRVPRGENGEETDDWLGLSVFNGI